MESNNKDVALTVTAKGSDMEFNWVKHGDHPDDDVTINPDNDKYHKTESVLKNAITKL